ncbi:MAG: S46 family peptidase [Bacteroidales bacterium]|nr:S46 family peptidase [Bacteroidales bacterium]
MKRISLILCTMLYALSLLADEGMWIPSLLGEQKLDEMRKKGLKLSAEDIYSINQASLKDAIVLFGRGCTGGIVSDKGLLLTNHHCGFGSIQRHSSIEHDYLTGGFWAMSREEELSNPGLTVSLLVRMEDVTDQVLSGIKAGMNEADRQKTIDEAGKTIIAEAIKDTRYQADIKPLFGGNQYFLYVTEVFKDIRLVGAPPSAIGNFGGDTDNWVWPRHTGDFSVFRIYADSNNLPADYAKGNVPYKPKKFLTVSLKGVDKGDFTMVYGYPASTSQYLPSYMVEFIAEGSNPDKIEIRRMKLDIMGSSMASDPEVRIQYASKYAGVANYWKKWLGESKGLERFHAVEKKEAFELDFQSWADQKGTTYSGILPDYRRLTEELKPFQSWIDNFSEAVWSLDIIRYAAGFRNLLAMEKPAAEDWQKEVDRLKAGIPGFFKDYDMATDRKLFYAMMDHFRRSVSRNELPDIYLFIDNKFGGDINTYTDWVYTASVFVSEERMTAFMGGINPKRAGKLEKDPVFKVMMSFYRKYSADYLQPYQKLMVRQDSLQRIYMKAIIEMEEDKLLFPDANFTLRVSFGVVNDYYPKDGVYYDYQTTLEGIMEKDDPDIYDYRVPGRLKELYEAKDYGQYGQDGVMNVCFTAANHTTGGNSGSPVLNANGELIGLNFDRNWEGTMSDIMYDPGRCRNIVLDIRYCLFIMDKYAGAGHLVEEMNIIKN